MTTNEFEWDEGEDAFPPEKRPLVQDSRTEARICAVQVCAQALLLNRDARDLAAEFTASQLPQRKADKKLFALVMEEAGTARERLWTLLQPELREGWEWPRMDPVLRATMWAAAAELSVQPTLPVAVLVNEYLNIAKGFLPPEEVRFLHPVLDSVAKKIRG